MNPNPSPLKLLSISFIRVFVEADFKTKIVNAREFDYNGAMVGFSSKHSKHDDGNWSVAVDFLTTNKDAKLIAPYEVHVQALGIFSIIDKLDPVIQERIVYESGSAIVYGAIREMVSSITARSVYGLLTLPTPSYMGHFDAMKKQQEQKKRSPKKSKVAKSKSFKVISP